ncbi:MAG: helix-turn-helix domain-containing protein [Lachnospiraceae bacterium]|nr:helix-turn-helix domain-containing protein [Lachnospiraceae bacterium]
MSNNKHMNLEARATIQQELDRGSSFKSIGALLEKDCTTISKEVRKHIVAQCIAKQTGMDADRAYIVGLLHDIGRRFGKRHLGHPYELVG